MIKTHFVHMISLISFQVSRKVSSFYVEIGRWIYQNCLKHFWTFHRPSTGVVCMCKGLKKNTLHSCKQCLLIAYERSESAQDNFGKFIHQFQPETKTLIRKLGRILIKLYRQNVSLLFNQTSLNERLQPNHTHTHTHTHTHIYIYIYIYIHHSDKSVVV